MTTNTTHIPLREYLEAPAPLIEAQAIFKRAIAVLRIIDRISTIELLPESPSIAQWIQEAQLLSRQSPPDSKRQNHKDPLRGFYKDHQPYVTLWYQPADTNLKASHDHLLAHLLIANHACRAYEADGEVFHSSRRTAFTFGRSICKPSYYVVLSRIPAAPLAPIKFLSILEEISKDHERANEFAVFIRYALGLKKSITRNIPARKKYPARKPIKDETDADPDQPPIITTVTKMPMLSPSMEHEVARSGLAPTEFEHYQELLEVSFSKENPMQGREAIDHAIRSRHVAKQITMRNQLLDARWELLSMPEVSYFLYEVGKLFRESHHSEYSPSEKLEKAELAALLSMIFWFSMPLEKALKARAYHSFPQCPRAPVIFVLEANRAKWLLVESIRPDYKSKSSQYRYVRTSNHIALNTGQRIENIIARHFVLSQSRRKLFVRPPDEYLVKIQEFLRSVNSHYSTRLTLNRIANFMFALLARQDMTYAMLITGRQNNIGSTPLYYTTVTDQTLKSVFRQTCQSVVHHVQREMGIKRKDVVNTPVMNCTASLLGARISPRDEDVRQLCCHLRHRVLHAG